ncbi:MAG: MoaD/ThiS family protein [Nocardioidaceae bacterium]|nr:MoaD/ThiS family protein [Nocardioidaceae bacterium]
MSGAALDSVSAGGRVTVRYWAAARAAAGVASDDVPLGADGTLAGVLEAVRALHPDRPRLGEVVAVCSVLVGDRPVGTAAPDEVRLADGDVVELLPPFAGG